MEAEEEKQDIAPDPYQAEKKAVFRLGLLGAFCLLVSLFLVAGAVWVALQSSSKSLQAFENLPTYRVGRLVVNYTKEVEEVDQSFASTTDLFKSEETNRLLRHARSVSETLLAGEKGFAETITLYQEVTRTIVLNTAGTREWNQHFQAELQSLLQNSQFRSEKLQAVVDSFPEPYTPDTPDIPSTDDTDTNAEPSKTSKSDLPNSKKASK